MSFVGKCTECGGPFWYRRVLDDRPNETVAERILRMATEPVDDDHFKCNNCLRR